MKKIFATFFTFLLALSLFFVFSPKANAKTGVQKVDGLVCNPGEDCSTQLRFAWRSSNSSCYFYFTMGGDETFANGTRVKVDGTLNKDAFPNQGSDTVVNLQVYTYEYEVSNLTPGTKYLYKVTTTKGDFSTGVHNVTTASLNGSFNFIWVGDDHLTCESWSKRTTFTTKMMNGAINQVKESGKGDINLIISTGDTVSYGSWYDDHLEWDESLGFTNFVFADSPGNHDYYTRVTGSSVMTSYPISWEASRNMPDNGYASYVNQGLKSNYYFIYNSCLFVSIDSIASHDSYKEQKQWLIDSVQALEGQYQWLIVYEHYPFFDGETAATSHYTNSDYANWWDTFDLLGVDLALSGDSHVYLRSKPLKNNKIDESGTVYMTCPQIGDRSRTITERQNDSWMAVRIGSSEGDYGLADKSGLGYITVTPQSLTYTLIDTSLAVKDRFTIDAKRQIPASLVEKQNEQAQILADSFKFMGYNGSDNEVLVFDYNRVNYIKKLEIKNGNETIVSTSKFNSSCIDLGNLDDNKVHELDVTLTLLDNSKLEFKVYGSTYAHYGSISNFRVAVEDGKTVLKWDANTTNMISGYEVFEGETSLGTTTTNSLALDSKKDVNTVYTLKAYTTNSETIFSATASYKLMGDINYDGSIDLGDCDAIAEVIFAGATLNDAQKFLGDVNKDGKVDYMDASYIALYKAGKIVQTVFESYQVTFKDETGKDIASVMVQYGNDAIEPARPTKNGYTFVGWSAPVTNVTSNLVVYAIFQKNN